MSATTDALRALIIDDATNSERSLQVALGPSQVGNDCDRCLALLLSGEQPHQGAPWLPWLGTAVHERLEYVVNRDLARGSTRWLTEATVTVGDLRGQPVTGHADLFDMDRGEVVDYKLVGTTTMKKVRRHGIPVGYRRQIHLYGAGFAALGHHVNTVTVWFLPRNDLHLDGGIAVTEPFDPDIAAATLRRANMLAAGIDSVGIDAVLDAAGAHKGSEFTCTQWARDAQPVDPAVTAAQLDGLLTPGDPAGTTAA